MTQEEIKAGPNEGDRVYTMCEPCNHIKQDLRWLDYLDLGTWREPEPGEAEAESAIAIHELGWGRPLA